MPRVSSSVRSLLEKPSASFDSSNLLQYHLTQERRLFSKANLKLKCTAAVAAWRQVGAS